MIKRTAWVLVALLVLASAGFYAVGGRTGVALLVVKYGLRKTYAPTRDVTRQPSPASAAPGTSGTAAGQRPPNVVLIVAYDLGFNDSPTTAAASPAAG
jgi:hypothetical protein